jgi:hypothetical protein
VFGDHGTWIVASYAPLVGGSVAAAEGEEDHDAVASGADGTRAAQFPVHRVEVGPLSGHARSLPYSKT